MTCLWWTKYLQTKCSLIVHSRYKRLSVPVVDLNDIDDIYKNCDGENISKNA